MPAMRVRDLGRCSWLAFAVCKSVLIWTDARCCAITVTPASARSFYPAASTRRERPALSFAREAVLAQGWSVIEVLGEPGEHHDPLGWEHACF